MITTLSGWSTLALAILLLLTHGAATAAEPQPRTWTRDDGRTVTATWLRTGDNQVHLRLPDGREFTVPLDRLSEADRSYLEEIAKPGQPSGSPEPQEEPPEAGVPELDPRSIRRVDPLTFAGLKFTPVESPHFLVLAKGVNGAKGAENAELVWRRLAQVHRQFRDRFAAGPEKPRLAVILVDRDGDWETLESWHVASLRNQGRDREADQAEATWPHTRGQGLYLDPESMQTLRVHKGLSAIHCGTLDDKNEVESAFRTHSLASHLMGLYVSDRLGDPPLWLTSGMGYYHEIRVCNRTVTHLVDYETYSSGKGKGDLRFSKRFADGSGWPDLVSEMAKRADPPPQLHRVLAAAVGTLSPELCGYVFGFADFVHGTPERTRAFASFLERPDLASVVRSPEAVSTALGFDSVKALEAAWSEHLLSSEFTR